MSDDRDSRGVRRVNVHRDGTRDVEEIKSDHPVIARLADLIQDQLVVEILHHELGVGLDQVDQDGLSRAAFSVAEEIDYYYVVTRRPRRDAPGKQD